jgi:hypothetical protein
MMLVVSVNPVAVVVVRAPTIVVGPVVRIAAVAIIAVISRIPVIAITVCRVTESNSNSADSD